MESLVARFVDGGFFMWPILLCSALGLALAVERWLVLKSAARLKKEELIMVIRSHVMRGDLERAVAVASKIKAPLTNIIKAGLVSVVNRGTPEEVQTAMDAVALKEIPLLEKRLGLLATLANVATLLGLLGTVDGLIGAFSAVSGVAPTEKAVLLSQSISAAMNTTAFGLIVAIPLLAVFGYLSSMAQSLVDEIHETSVATLNFILSNREHVQN